MLSSLVHVTVDPALMFMDDGANAKLAMETDILVGFGDGIGAGVGFGAGAGTGTGFGVGVGEGVGVTTGMVAVVC